MTRTTVALGVAALTFMLGACGGVAMDAPDAGDEDPEVDAATPADAATCAPEPAGLRARWRGENDAADETGQFPGVPSGDLAYTPGRHGSAFTFGGGSDGVSADPGDALWPVGSFTIEAWVRTTVSDLPFTNLFNKYGCGGADACDPSFWGFYLTEEGRAYGEVRVTGGPALVVTAALTPIDDGEWHHLVMVRDVEAGQLRLHVDGALEASAAITGTFGDPMDDFDGVPDVVTIGTGRSSSLDTFSDGLIGAIDEPAYYISAWTAEEVAAAHAAPDGFCR